MKKRLILTWTLLFFVLSLLSQGIYEAKATSRENVNGSSVKSPYELTIFIIPAKVKYNWDSPNTLYHSLINNYIKNIFKKEKYLLGHAFIELKVPSESDKLFSGMAVSSLKSEKHYLFKEYYGLSILGADLPGRLESNSELVPKVDKYSRKGDLAFIKLLINKNAAERMLEFLRTFQSGNDSIRSPKFHYGGAFWPRYYGEGSGCAAYIMSYLSLGGLLKDEYADWLVDVNLPKKLMGGPFNEGNEVKLKDVRKCHSWADGESDDADSFVPFKIYDPILISEWINEIYADPESQEKYRALPLTLNKARGIMIDCRDVPAPMNDSIFSTRENPSVFIEYYQEKIGARE